MLNNGYTVIAVANRAIIQRLRKGERRGGQVEPGENSGGICRERS